MKPKYTNKKDLYRKHECPAKVLLTTSNVANKAGNFSFRTDGFIAQLLPFFQQNHYITLIADSSTIFHNSAVDLFRGLIKRAPATYNVSNLSDKGREKPVGMESLLFLVKIILVNIVLSGDNAVIIAMASKNLPEPQRNRAVWWGTLGAVAMRIGLTAAAIVLLTVPMIQLAGGIMLFFIAVKLLVDDEGHKKGVKSGFTLTGAIWAIVTADFIMSLDNVLAVAAIANGHWLLTSIGILISIPLIVWGSTLVIRLLNQYPVLIYIGACILGYTAGEMSLKDEFVSRWLAESPHIVWRLLPIAAATAVIGAGLWKRKRVKTP